jgi:hypothetical protein
MTSFQADIHQIWHEPLDDLASSLVDPRDLVELGDPLAELADVVRAHRLAHLGAREGRFGGIRSMMINRSIWRLVPIFILSCRIVRDRQQVFRFSVGGCDFTFLNAVGLRLASCPGAARHYYLKTPKAAGHTASGLFNADRYQLPSAKMSSRRVCSSGSPFGSLRLGTSANRAILMLRLLHLIMCRIWQRCPHGRDCNSTLH